ncbi:MAG: hypothetical protein ACI8XV_003424, partial [Arenicella sp.]
MDCWSEIKRLFQNSKRPSASNCRWPFFVGRVKSLNNAYLTNTATPSLIVCNTAISLIASG